MTDRASDQINHILDAQLKGESSVHKKAKKKYIFPIKFKSQERNIESFSSTCIREGALILSKCHFLYETLIFLNLYSYYFFGSFFIHLPTFKIYFQGWIFSLEDLLDLVSLVTSPLMSFFSMYYKIEKRPQNLT